MMTRQEIYDKVKAHLLAQGCQSIDGDWNCLYRAPNKLKCAIGALIADEHYTDAMETATPTQTDDTPEQAALMKALRASGISVDEEGDREFLRDLQKVHDELPVVSWPDALAGCARRWGLRA